MTTVTSLTPRVNIDDEGHASLALDAFGVQVWDIEFSDEDPIGFSAPSARAAETGALLYLSEK